MVLLCLKREQSLRIRLPCSSSPTPCRYVQRNINQQSRIQRGVQSGALSNKEVSRLEGGQARVNRAEARAEADGHVSAGEQRRIQHKENKQSRQIVREKHTNR